MFYRAQIFPPLNFQLLHHLNGLPPFGKISENDKKITIIIERASAINYSFLYSIFFSPLFFFFLPFLLLSSPRVFVVRFLLLLFPPLPILGPSPVSSTAVYLRLHRSSSNSCICEFVLPITGSINIVTITNSASRCALTMTPLESQGYCYLHRSHSLSLSLSLPRSLSVAYDR